MSSSERKKEKTKEKSMIKGGKTTKGEKEKRVKILAKKVQKNIMEGKRGGIVQAMQDIGYARSTAESRSGEITGDPVYKAEMKKFEERLDRMIDISFEIAEAKKDSATFAHGIDAVDKMTKLKRLVEGKSTDNRATVISGLLDSMEDGEEDKTGQE